MFTQLVFLTTAFYIPGIILSAFFAALLFSKKNKRGSDTILAFWLMFLGINLGLSYFRDSNRDLTYPWMLGLVIPVPLVYGPFLYLYVSSLTNQFTRKYSYLHFMPFLINYLVMLPFFLLSPGEKITVFRNEGAGYEWLLMSDFTAIVISGVTYVVLSFVKLNRHKKNINQQFSNTERINLLWLRYLICGMAGIWLVVILSTNYYIYTAVSLFIFFIGYFGIRQVGIFTNVIEENAASNLLKQAPIKKTEQFKQSTETVTASTTEKISVPDRSIKYARSGLTDETARQIHEQLTEVMQNEKPFTDPNLTLAQLAKKIQVYDNHLSQVINSLEKKNFYDYINTLRVDEFKNAVVLPGNQQYTLLSLAFACGFNSKTSFNRNFKKHTGLSPTEYLNQKSIHLSPDELVS